MKKLMPYFLVIFISCNQETYNNKSQYNLEVGEVIEIYIGYPSRGGYCTTEFETFQHIEFVKKRIIEEGDQDCFDCKSMVGLSFRAISAGQDTIRIDRLGKTEVCDLFSSESQRIIFRVHHR